MRMTLDLPDDLMMEAKAAAARRGITLRELFIIALERDLARSEPLSLYKERIVD